MPFDHPHFDDHDGGHLRRDPGSGLYAIIAVHRRRGDAGSVGGIRFRRYRSDLDALTDALRLSRAMTYKNVLADQDVGGGKAVIIGDPATARTPELLAAMGRAIEILGGADIGGPDVGTTPADMDLIATETSVVGGTTAEMGEGGSAPPTAVGVFSAIRALAGLLGCGSSLDGVSVAVQGAGAVGSRLTGHLTEAGARVTIAGIDPEAVRRVVTSTGATPGGADEILRGATRGCRRDPPVRHPWVPTRSSGATPTHSRRALSVPCCRTARSSASPYAGLRGGQQPARHTDHG
ncbi:MAG: Glu/Leu/Phe/Val dehydrogenase dimerization domain-containing protein [Acidimicrobiales bacterium]